tara:strand:- start:4223 stop:5110 length:888 start_codon:yes stop_codon:yes gene_type:complete
MLFAPFLSNGQEYFSEHFGVSIGISTNFGTHINSIGLTLNGYWTDYFVQINAKSSLHFHLTNLGERKKYFEARTAFGAVLLVGKKERDTIDFQLDAVNHQTKYNFGLGYNYIIYHDNINSTQRSGGFAVHLKDFTIYHENDIFAGQGRDRFRTGQFHFAYRYQDYKFGLGVKMWTGETRGGQHVDFVNDKIRGGYRTLDHLPYGKTSHGIFYGAFSYNLPYKQDAFMKIGIDSEEIRHAIQNRLIHDLIFLPKSVKHHSSHYPRLDEFGCPVFERNSTKKDRLHFQLGTGDAWYH